ncbi:hypothetical protein NW755_14951 [Fusarium falciforme]|uniref:Reverse transcriptase n=1 Tax=Fusarium falciforme TaxID=195108 RepID=A0A9W8QRX6_9HYPO|nr:hypothetical protein NW755_14951 [Fusarium falciforme]
MTVTYEEAQHAATSTGNTSPGSDNITVALIKACWLSIGEYTRRLYEACLRLGHHPPVFKQAEVVMIPKPNKRDLTSPRSWRPISLLSCLSKGLERLIAGRLAYAAIGQDVLHPQQIGALPKRSAVDLVAALIHEIEAALDAGLVATLVTMDVLGAFDAVMRNRLLLRLREQGWPPSLARWAGSFMTDRRAMVRLQDTVTEMAPLSCGLPQGSPASPILFLLYTEPIYRLGAQTFSHPSIKVTAQPARRFGYADDTAMLRIGRTLKDTATESDGDISDLTGWGRENGVTFDIEKTEVMHFSRKGNKDSPPIHHDGTAKYAEEAMRWLGVWLDRKLSFKTHVMKWAVKARKITNLLRSFTSTTRGLGPAAVQKAVRACVEPTLLYAAEAWYAGRTVQRIIPSQPQDTRTVSTCSESLIRYIDSTVKTSIRAVLPVWKTTPLAAIHRESGIPPAEQLLESVRQRFSARIQSLDQKHPLTQRATAEVLQGARRRRGPAKLQRTAALLPRAPRPILLPKKNLRLPPLKGDYTKSHGALIFRAWLRSTNGKDLVVYSDGSQAPSGATSYGYAIYRRKLLVDEGCGRLGPAEVFDGEAAGALEGLKAAARFAGPTDRIWVCLDNTSAAECLRGNPSDSSQSIFLEFQAIAAAHGRVRVKWCPGHEGIEGNERADALAKAGSALPEPPGAQPTLAFVRRQAKARPRAKFSTWWAANTPEAYKPLRLKALLKCPKELQVPRGALHHLLAARSAHGDFAGYHERFQHEDARLNCSCGRRKSPDHLFYCRKIIPSKRPRLAPAPRKAIERIIGRDFEDYIKFTKATAFFTVVCPRY